MKKSGRTTAAELMARLNADPEYVARKRIQDEERRRKEEEYARAEAPLVQALNAAGIPASSVWDLVNAGKKRPSRAFRISTDPPEALWNWLEGNGWSYASILPVLLDHLQRPYPPAVREGIARALAVPEAKSAWQVLVKLFKRETNDRVKDGLAVALSNVADLSLMNELMDLICDTQNGESRVLLLNWLERYRYPRTQEILEELEADPQLRKEVQAIFKRLERKQRLNKKSKKE